MAAWMSSYCRLATRDPRYAEVHEWCRVPAAAPLEPCGCDCHKEKPLPHLDEPAPQPGREARTACTAAPSNDVTPEGRQWISLGELIGGPSDAV